MRLLLDTHALLWAAHEPALLGAAAIRAMRDGDNPIFVSSVSAMEIAAKRRTGKLEYDSALTRNFVSEIESRGFAMVSISCAHAERAGGYQCTNLDPWDRLLAAQAEIDGLTLVSCDANMAGFNISTLW